MPHAAHGAMHPEPNRPPADGHLVHIDAGGVVLEGELAIPKAARGVVVLVHASGSGRHTPRSLLVARALRDDVNVGTLVVDLFSPAEEQLDLRTAKLRFDIPLLAERTAAVADWLDDLHARGLPIALLASSTAVAAALTVAAERADLVDLVVARNGRPDLAPRSVLSAVEKPILFLVGGADPDAVAQHRRASELMRGRHDVEIIPGASHVFDEPGKLGEVARRAAHWLARELDVLESAAPVVPPPTS